MARRQPTSIYGTVLKLLQVVLTGIGIAVAAPSRAQDSNAVHRTTVDAGAYPWSAIGKLYNSNQGACTGVAISRNQVLTAAHCLINRRTHRFVPATSLHFLFGYRNGEFIGHARVARYDIGPGYIPFGSKKTPAADWVVLTLTENIPAQIKPLKLVRSALPRGTRVVVAGYPQDRAYAMTADRDCELRGLANAGQLLLHTCRGIHGYSGAPLLVAAGDHEYEIAGMHVATLRRDGATTMIAVPAQRIPFQSLK